MIVVFPGYSHLFKMITVVFNIFVLIESVTHKGKLHDFPILTLSRQYKD